jgi:hypothetical protein
LWESRLPELFVKDYNLPWPQRYYEDVATWDLIIHTQFSGAALAADKGLRTALAVNQIFVTDADGNVVKNK